MIAAGTTDRTCDPLSEPWCGSLDLGGVGSDRRVHDEITVELLAVLLNSLLPLDGDLEGRLAGRAGTVDRLIDGRLDLAVGLLDLAQGRLKGDDVLHGAPQLAVL